ncbi:MULTISPECIES: SdiA-regulated domain-containing protein [Flavobacterium]|uniref:SdiA-regulated domain-containing protein n=1 Tax=Flavobacterium TaxID=237 RepID=UPI001FCB266B|nr:MULTISPECIES: SdiA-regulated domain-containing protein [Flavobacterium]UOK41362.1 SdiA-regulated domain-containing protein [Flavobacterium enshiense]
MNRFFKLFLVCLFVSSCESQTTRRPNNVFKIQNNISAPTDSSRSVIPYSLSKPNKKYHLPAILEEVSGLTDIDSAHVACVQDEIGTVFIYNFLVDSIIARHKFDSVGDFEGLTFTGKSLFILRSDGRLTEWKNFNPKTGSGKVSHTMLPLQTTNNEGLCFDNRKNRLLIAAKSKPMNHDYKSERFIYEFDLIKNKLNKNPVYSINTIELEAAAREFSIVQQNNTETGKLRPFNFRPSSLAVHPQTSDIYIISAADKLLLVINEQGEIRNMERLNDDLFAKAEGITFLKDGTMIITNEAAGRVPTLLIFKPTK